MIAADERWALGIGDPTLLGWSTVAAYFTTAALCWYASLRSDYKHNSISMATPFFWRILALTLLLLGFNKQLDFQSLLTEIGKDMAIAQGWYERRRFVQLAFIATLGIFGIFGLVIIAMLMRHFDNAVRISLLGIAVLVIFVIMRAASFHFIDSMIDYTFLGMRLNGWFELGSLCCITLGALMYCKNNAHITQNA